MIYEDLKGFTACLWPIASASRSDLATVGVESAAHVGAAAVVNSCQRIEAYSFGECGCRPPQQKTGIDALLHLAEVAAGIHSAVLGEEQVLGQVRSAFAAAPANLQQAAEIAVSVARELRREAAFTTHSGHLLDRALRVAEAPFRGRILVVGTGHMGRLVAQRALELGFDEVVVSGRRQPDAPWFASGRFRFLALESLPSAPPFEVAVGCLGSEAAELDVRSALPPVSRLIVDLGTPNTFSGRTDVPLISIAALLSESMGGRSHAAARREALRDRVRTLVERRIDMLSADCSSSVGSLRLSVEQVRQRELGRMRRLHPEIPLQTLDVITKSLVNQIFHTPSLRLKNAGDHALGQQLAALFAASESEAVEQR